MNCTIIDHPLVQHKLALLRDENTGSKEFRELVGETAMLICYEAMRDLPTQATQVKTPFGTADARLISGKKLALVPIMRSGLGMVDGIMKAIPAAKVGHIGTFRDPYTADTTEYYCKLPSDMKHRIAIIADICIATGGAACEAIRLVKNAGCTDIRYLSIVATEQGIDHINAAHPDVKVYTAAVDSGLNEEMFVVPGIGDSGARMYGTR
ncbi:MAG: uracil phosphoribosyltransferase [Oscillospiraceae bacterium]|nr:uracil phosphoribosyltransferase [Oscillospiraceae bacterium]MBR4346126.1 uracil phosphoribosyltransferase [Oscillospiraceae bacterium]